MSAFPHYIEEVDFLILAQLSDQDFAQACRSNVYAAELCKKDYLWKLRSDIYRKPFLHLRKYFDSWSNFYQNIMYNSLYTLYSGRTYEFFSTPEKMYQAYSDKTYDMIEEDLDELEPQEILELNKRKDWPGMYLLIAGFETKLYDPEFIISPVADLSEYPSLTPEGNFVFYFGGRTNDYFEPNISLNLIRPTQSNIQKMSEYAKQGITRGFTIPPIDQVLYRPIKFKYLNNNLFVVYETPSLMLDEINGEYRINYLPTEYQSILDQHEEYFSQSLYPQLKPNFIWLPVEQMMYLPIHLYNRR